MYPGGCHDNRLLIKSSACPFVNLGGPKASPVQVVSDLYTILDGLSTLKDVIIAVVGDCANGIAADIIRGSRMGYKVRCVCPASCKPTEQLITEFVRVMSS